MPRSEISTQPANSSNYSKFFGIAIILIIGPIFLFFILGPLLIISYLFLIRPVQIRGEAMMPRYVQGQYYMSRILSRSGEIKRGDVVVFQSPRNPDLDFFKRVIALPYEKVMIRNGKVLINGIELNESQYLSSDITTQAFAAGAIKEGEEFTIPADYYFVMGDNRAKSDDSRVFGPIPRSTIRSKMFFCYYGCNKTTRGGMMRY